MIGKFADQADARRRSKRSALRAAGERLLAFARMASAASPPGRAATMLPPPIAPHEPESFVAPPPPPLSTATRALFAGVIPPTPREPLGTRLEKWVGDCVRVLERWTV